MEWSFTTDRPIYLQIMEQMKLGIVAGVYQPGERLPSVRDLAMEAAVNPNTMQKALGELEREGLVFSQRTSGRFISEDTAMIDEARQELARENITLFLENMSRLGFSRQDVLEMMGKIIAEEG